jgi:N-acetylmuramoyl-L-alanine amidase
MPFGIMQVTNGVVNQGVRELFSCKPVIPAEAGIQIFSAKETGCPPDVGMTANLPDTSVNRPPETDMLAAKWFFSSPLVLPAFFLILLFCIFTSDANAKQTLFKKNMPVIVIDPGHGGTDAGAKGPNDTLEKTVTLNLAHILAKQMQERYRVVLTRNGDYGLDHPGRTAVANQAKAEIFISLHTGSSFIHNINGSTVYFYQPFQESALTSETRSPKPLQDSNPAVSWEMIQAKYRKTSENLAGQIHSRLSALWQPQNVKVQGTPLLVLEGADMPAVAIEIGNLTNPTSEKALGDPGFLSRVAKAITSGIDAFFAEKEK